MKRALLLLDSSPTGTGELYFERARMLGLEPILVSKKPDDHAGLSQFRSLKVRHMRLEVILGAIDTFGRDRVVGVCSSLSQRAELVARVAQAIGRPHSNPDAVAVCCDKFETRDKLAKAGIRDVAFESAHTGQESRDAARRLGGTVIIKPRVSSGATGVGICRSPEEAHEFVDGLVAIMPLIREVGVVVERYVEGPQFGVEIFDAKAIVVRRKHISPAPASIPTGHDCPAPDDPAICSAIAAHAERATAAAGYVRGPAHVELRYGPAGPCIIEINPRVAGALGPENVRRAIGVDLIEATIRFACDLPYDLTPKRNGASSVRHLLRNGSAVSAVLGREEALRMPGVADVGTFPAWFSRSGPARNFEDRIAYVISEANTAEEAIRSAEAGLRRLVPVPEPRWRNALRTLKDQVWSG